MKDRLKQKSPTFRWLNGRIDPFFNRIRDSIVTSVEVEEARRFAREAGEHDEDVGHEAGK